VTATACAIAGDGAVVVVGDPQAVCPRQSTMTPTGRRAAGKRPSFRLASIVQRRLRRQPPGVKLSKRNRNVPCLSSIEMSPLNNRGQAPIATRSAARPCTWLTDRARHSGTSGSLNDRRQGCVGAGRLDVPGTLGRSDSGAGGGVTRDGRGAAAGISTATGARI
jgi:hypothetical protein